MRSFELNHHHWGTLNRLCPPACVLLAYFVFFFFFLSFLFLLFMRLRPSSVVFHLSALLSVNSWLFLREQFSSICSVFRFFFFCVVADVYSVLIFLLFVFNSRIWFFSVLRSLVAVLQKLFFPSSLIFNFPPTHYTFFTFTVTDFVFFF